MKKLVIIVLLLGGLIGLPAARAVDGKSLLIGISIGLGVYGYQGTRTHVVAPAVRAVQRVIRPIPQDKVDRANRKAEKARKKAAKKQASIFDHSERVKPDVTQISCEEKSNHD